MSPPAQDTVVRWWDRTTAGAARVVDWDGAHRRPTWRPARPPGRRSRERRRARRTRSCRSGRPYGAPDVPEPPTLDDDLRPSLRHVLSIDHERGEPPGRSRRPPSRRLLAGEVVVLEGDVGVERSSHASVSSGTLSSCCIEIEAGYERSLAFLGSNTGALTTVAGRFSPRISTESLVPSEASSIGRYPRAIVVSTTCPCSAAAT